MSFVLHKTPGLLDVRAFTLMGVSAKPNSTNPIGQFGTGLKYSISTLVRMGCNVVLYIGLDRYEFFSEKQDFRGAEFHMIRMKKKKWSLLKASKHDLPYSTNYGKNWQSWQVFRELEANTRDEGGETTLIEYEDSDPENLWPGPDANSTCFIIDLPEYIQAYKDRDKIFLPESKTILDDSLVSSIEIREGESKHIYYRGMRALDLDKPTKYTYNIVNPITLTEDRTIAYAFQVRSLLALHLLTSQNEEMIEAVMTGGKDYWEYNLEFPSHVAGGAAFERVMKRKPKGFWSSGYSHWTGRNPTPRTGDIDLAKRHPTPWQVQGYQVVDAAGRVVFEGPQTYDLGDWPAVARRIIHKLGYRQEDEAFYVEPPVDPDLITFGEDDKGEIWADTTEGLEDGLV